MTAPISPWFPSEILEKIILEAWFLPLSVDDRITLMTSSLLVSKIWMTAFTRVSSRDVYIPCASYADQYFRILREESPIYDEHTRTLPDYLCRSLTFQFHNVASDEVPMVQLFNDNLRYGESLDYTLYTIRSLSYLPNLRHIVIEYANWAFDDLLDHYRLIAFPDQVTELELKYTFSECIPQPLIDGLRSSYVQHQCLSLSMPNVRLLSVVGAPASFVTDMASTCPNAEIITDVGRPCDLAQPLR
jgi:hypothetical protein